MSAVKHNAAFHKNYNRGSRCAGRLWRYSAPRRGKRAKSADAGKEVPENSV
ncbi:MAG: hypothetical protein IIZ08_06360 [Clostridia bacterium]|nr:hypothetical protein [Clostridia bacterium]